MKKHEWELDQSMCSEHYIIMCRECGISYFGRPKTDNWEPPKFTNSSCPPWDSQGRGDIKAKRIYEVEVVQELKEISDSLKSAQKTHDYAVYEAAQSGISKGMSINGNLRDAYDQINQLIEKLEDQAGG